MSVARNNVVTILWIENADFLHGDVEHARNLVEAHAIVHLHGVDNERFLRQCGVDVVLLIIVHHIGGGDESRHIAAGFLRQIFVDGPIVGLVVVFHPAQGFVHVCRSAVVGGNGERPIIVDAIQLLEIRCGGFARLVGVAAFVHQGVDFQAEVFAGVDHKLPKSGSTRIRHHIGVERRFYDGNVFQFVGQPFFFECALKDGHIVGGHTQQLRHHGALFGDVAGDVGFHHRVEWQFHARRNGAQALNILGVAHFFRRFAFHFIVDHGIILQIPVGLHFAGVDFKTVGVDD